MAGKDRPIMSNRFSVFLGPLKMGFSGVRNLMSEMEVEVIREGGVNDHVHVLRRPQTQVQKLIFERGICAGNVLSSLVTLGIGKSLMLPGMILVKNQSGSSVSGYSFTNPTILKWSASDLDASGSQVLIEKFEIAHNGLMIMPISLLNNMLDLFKGDSDGLGL